jgi:hypothetical protein
MFSPCERGRGEGLACAFPLYPNPLPKGEREPLDAVFMPAPQRGEGTARCCLFPRAPKGGGNRSVLSLPLRPKGERVPLGAVFTPAPQRGEGTARCRLYPSPKGERGSLGVFFSPSPLWGEGRGEGAKPHEITDPLLTSDSSLHRSGWRRPHHFAIRLSSRFPHPGTVIYRSPLPG